jgi:hypothetical protein
MEKQHYPVDVWNGVTDGRSPESQVWITPDGYIEFVATPTTEDGVAVGITIGQWFSNSCCCSFCKGLRAACALPKGHSDLLYAAGVERDRQERLAGTGFELDRQERPAKREIA